ncbi:MAG: hypothetical protein RSC49_08270 [Clostridium sp.]
MKKVIQDLHGNVFNYEEFHINPGNECPIVVHKDEDKIFTKDLVSGQSFLLARYGSKYGYVFHVGDIWVYGPLEYVSHNPKNDIRSYGKR